MKSPILPRLQGGPGRLPAEKYSEATASSAIEFADKRLGMAGEGGSSVRTLDRAWSEIILVLSDYVVVMRSSRAFQDDREMAFGSQESSLGQGKE